MRTEGIYTQRGRREEMRKGKGKREKDRAREGKDGSAWRSYTFTRCGVQRWLTRSRRLGRVRVLTGFPQREIKKGRRPSARGSRAKIIKTRARFAAAASLSARSRRFISGYTSGYPPAGLSPGRLQLSSSIIRP